MPTILSIGIVDFEEKFNIPIIDCIAFYVRIKYCSHTNLEIVIN